MGCEESQNPHIFTTLSIYIIFYQSMYEEDDIPKQWYCPISQELMKEPVIAADGFTYEKKFIQNWFNKSGSSPVTGSRLFNVNLIPNHALRHTIEQYINKKNKLVQVKVPVHEVIPQEQHNDDSMKCSMDTYVEDSFYYVDCKFVPPQKPKQVGRQPCSIFCVLDSSQSMDQDAVLGGKDVQSHGFSRLDLVRHSINTMTQFMSDSDEICLISFDNSAKVLLPLTKTTKPGKALVASQLKKISAKKSTNIWDGLKTSLDLAKPLMAHIQHRNIFVVLLTDGQPNLNPPRGILPTLKKYMMIQEMPTPNVHVFGYGYELNTPLLMDIAQLGHGTYTYIPDCSMVGTAFVNFMANSLSCISNKIQLRFQFAEGVDDVEVVGAGKLEDLLYNLGSIQYGQERNVILKFKERVALGGFNTLGKLSICDGNNKEPITYDLPVRHFPQSPEYIKNIKIRVKYIQLLNKLVKVKLTMKQSFELVEEFFEFLKKQQQTQFVKILKKQIKNPQNQNQGQVSKAFQKQQWHQKWGKHYIPSLYLAHQMQACTNFKDPALQLYGGEQFQKNRNKMDTMFIKMPPPQPTAKKQKHIVYKPAPVDMEDYYDAQGGCISQGCNVSMSDGSTKPIQLLKKGDRVKVSDGRTAQVQCLVKSNVFKQVPMVKIGKLIITPWHPIKCQGEWTFPAQKQRKQTKFIESYYNYVLKGGQSLICEGIQCISLGHGIKNDVVATHEYLGSEKVVEDLKKSRRYREGKVKVRQFLRDAQTRLIKNIEVQI